MGTGVGGGIIIDGKIHHGRTNIAGEWGHHCLHTEGNSCYCGNKGCVETYISGPALEKNGLSLLVKINLYPKSSKVQIIQIFQIGRNHFLMTLVHPWQMSLIFWIQI